MTLACKWSKFTAGDSLWICAHWPTRGIGVASTENAQVFFLSTSLLLSPERAVCVLAIHNFLVFWTNVELFFIKKNIWSTVRTYISKTIISIYLSGSSFTCYILSQMRVFTEVILVVWDLALLSNKKEGWDRWAEQIEVPLTSPLDPGLTLPLDVHNLVESISSEMRYRNGSFLEHLPYKHLFSNSNSSPHTCFRPAPDSSTLQSLSPQAIYGHATTQYVQAPQINVWGSPSVWALYLCASSPYPHYLSSQHPQNSGKEKK